MRLPRDEMRQVLERAAAWVYPRRCPFCNALLGPDAVQGSFCPDCDQEEKRLAHEPPRLPETEHAFYALHHAATAYYYDGLVQRAILLCKSGGHPWYARELADRMAIRIWGAEPAQQPGSRPRDRLFVSLPAYHCIVPVPPHRPQPGVPGLPFQLARRLSVLFSIPVETPLQVLPGTAVQKGLSREERMQNAKQAFRCREGADLSGKRVLLIDDIITTGSTVSACALALLKAGAVDVTAAAIAADEELPKEKRTSTEKSK